LIPFDWFRFGSIWFLVLVSVSVSFYFFISSNSFSLASVSYPEYLDMQPYFSASSKSDSTSDAPMLYELCSVLIHQGGSSSGHYYAFVKVQ
jgi:hypothetical protein